MNHPTCACGQCDPNLAAPTMPRLGDHHVGVRFKTHEETKNWVFRVDGVVVPQVIEAVAGPEGWAYAYVVREREKVAHLCKSCLRGACAQFVRGSTRIFRDGKEVVAP